LSSAETACYPADSKGAKAVRLRSCVAIELAVGAFVAAACAGAAMWGLTELRALDSREARADAMPGVAATQLEATQPEQPVAAPRPEPAQPEAPSSDTAPWLGVFGGKPDGELLAPLRESGITQVKFNRGGTSISLRIDLENGGRAACKPSQIHIHSQPRREIAAFRVNRLLGLSAVPPAVGRRFRFSDIVDHLRDPLHKKRVVAEGSPESASSPRAHRKRTGRCSPSYPGGYPSWRRRGSRASAWTAPTGW
jgi:hypothetical protein